MVENRRETAVAVSRVAAFVLLLLMSSSAAEAQQRSFFGLLNGQIGAAAGGDVRDVTFNPAISTAVVDDSGLGVELELGHMGDFDTELFEDSTVTSLMLNLLVLYPHETFRPFVTAGVGLMRLRAEIVDEQGTLGSTEAGFSAGGGLLYMFNEAYGVRGDIRYLRHFERQDDVPLGGNGILGFWRTSIGFTFTWPLQ
jgi:opacity protein-like surface antigen